MQTAVIHWQEEYSHMPKLCMPPTQSTSHTRSGSVNIPMYGASKYGPMIPLMHSLKDETSPHQPQ